MILFCAPSTPATAAPHHPVESAADGGGARRIFPVVVVVVAVQAGRVVHVLGEVGADHLLKPEVA